METLQKWLESLRSESTKRVYTAGIKTFLSSIHQIYIGINAPMAFFPFSGAKESFFGDLHGQGRDAITFFTDRKIVRAPRVV